MLLEKYSWVIVALLITTNVQAQQMTFRNLSIGDTLPDFVIPKIMNSAMPTGHTADFKDQLLIIDFWSIYCGGCVAALPKMEKLQKTFGNKIKVLPVTNEKEEVVKQFWLKNKYTHNLTLPSVVNDSLFHQCFKHAGVPHEIWVYKGKVIAITEADYVDAHNIQKVLDGETINWPVKYDYYAFDGSKKPLFQTDSNQIDLQTTPIQYAAISDYKEGVNSTGLTGGSGTVRDSVHKTVRTFFLNQSIYTLYCSNWIKLMFDTLTLKKPSDVIIAPNEVLWQVKDKSRYFFDSKQNYLAEWIRKNGICFESLYPDAGQQEQDIAKSVIADLDRLLGLRVRWEKRKEKVYLLVRANKNIHLKSKGRVTAMEYNMSNERGLYKFRDVPLSTLVFQLNEQADNPYVFDQSDYKERVDLNLKFSSWTDIPSIKKALQAYGLDLKEEEQLVDKLVFTEINGGLLYQKKPEL